MKGHGARAPIDFPRILLPATTQDASSALSKTVQLILIPAHPAPAPPPPPCFAALERNNLPVHSPAFLPPSSPPSIRFRYIDYWLPLSRQKQQ